MARPKTEKSNYVKLSGVKIDPEDWAEFGTYYTAHGMRTKVVRALIRRHLKTLRELTARNAPDLNEAIISINEMNEE